MAEKENDPLDNQKYYIGKTGLRHIDIVDEFDLDYNEGSALKYLIRRGRKFNAICPLDQREDLTKAIWHLKRKLAKL